MEAHFSRRDQLSLIVHWKKYYVMHHRMESILSLNYLSLIHINDLLLCRHFSMFMCEGT